MNETLISKDVPRNRLLVEGSDDLNVCRHLLNCYHIQVSEQVEIVDKHGIENLLQSLEVELIASGPRRLGILVDADDDLVTRWQSLLAILKNAGYSGAPNHPSPEGTIIKEEDKPIVGIWLMPNNQLPGMIEHFCSFMIPPEDRLWHTAKNILQEVVKHDRRFPEQHQIKAQIHTWLAWQKEPGKPMGQAITKRFFDHTTPHAQQFMDWIRRLYDIGQR